MSRMPWVPLVRAKHLNIYLGIYRDIGAPVDRALHRARLPGSIEETPDAYLHVPRVLDCVLGLGRPQDAMELGFLAAQRMTLNSLRPEFQRAIHHAPTVLERLRAIVRHAPREDSALRSGIVNEGKNLRVFCDLAAFYRSPALAYSEWLQLDGIVSVVQSVAGPAWRPEEMTFVSRLAPSNAAAEEFANTRILTSQPHTSVLVPIRLIGMLCPLQLSSQDTHDGVFGDEGEGEGTAASVREIVKPYLATKPLHFSELAEIFGMSERSLQRRLNKLGLSYAQLVADARYQVACDLLSRRDTKITEVALAAGYENPSHFSRAFRRMGGVSPREFRNFVQGLD